MMVVQDVNPQCASTLLRCLTEPAGTCRTESLPLHLKVPVDL